MNARFFLFKGLGLVSVVAALVCLAVSLSASAKDKEKASGTAAEHKSGKKHQYRKTQEVSFEETDINGQIRSPDGAYLLQKRGVRFLPLYEVNNQFEKNILESVEYLR